MGWALGIDTGGTFTDVIAFNFDTGLIQTLKVPSTPADPSQGVLNGVEAFLKAVPSAQAKDIEFFAHGTTVAANAVIERKGSRTGLLITKGTRAVYEARMSRQPPPAEMLNPNFSKSPPLVPSRLTREIPERILFDGAVESTLDEAAVLSSVDELVRLYDVESIAVCYLFSFMNDRHERRTRELIHQNFSGLRVSLSSAVVPIIREYRRLSTTVLDAYVGPTLSTYLERLREGLRQRGINGKQVFIMQSNGGLMSIDVASSNPVQTLLSGPAAGVISGAYLGGLTCLKNVATFDVGGTSTDIATIIDGNVTEVSGGVIAGQDAAIPMNEIGTIGAGGGTIARIGDDGRLKVGPESAGACPGPACYGHGGVEPTVTDADLLLGYLDPAYFLGGQFSLDGDAAARAVSKIAKRLNLSVEGAAAGIVTIANSYMESELRLRLMARGFDPRVFAMVALGGAGPVHACMVAKNLGVQTVVVPPYPGLGSAMGLLLTDIKHHYSCSRLRLLDEFSVAELASEFASLMTQAIAEAESEGTDPANIIFEGYLDLRYVGQGYELSVPYLHSDADETLKADVARRFHDMHKTLYGHSAPHERLEVVSFRLTTRSPLRKFSLGKSSKGAATSTQVKSIRKVYFQETADFVETPVYDRASLPAGLRVSGPVLIEQPDTTTVVVPGQTLRVDDYQNLIVTLD
jgi:N-methylhydantoinase A